MYKSSFEITQAIKQTENSFADSGVKITKSFAFDYPLLQRQLFNSNLRLAGLSEQQGSRKIQVRFLLRVLKEELFDRQSDKIEKRDIVFLTPSTSRRFKINGKWVDGVLTPVMESGPVRQKKLDFFQYEVPAFGDYRLPKFNKSRLIGLDEIRLRAKSRVLKSNAAQPPEELDTYRKAAMENGLDTNSISDKNWLSLANYMALRSAAFEKELAVARPRLAITFPWYGTINMAFLRAAHALGIKTVDYQHGIQGQEHAAYTNWPAFCLESDLFPQNFVVWRKDDKEWLDSWIGKKRNSLVGGVAWHAFSKDLLLEDEHVKQLVRKLGDASNKRKVILVTLQPFPDEFAGWLKKQLRMPGAEKYEWMIRCHPGHLSDMGRQVADFENLPNVASIKAATLAPLVSVLNLSSIHVTDYSSVVQEAALLGIPSLIRSGAREYFKDEIKAGIARPIYRETSLIEQIAGITGYEASNRTAPGEQLSSAMKSLLEP